jgi:hypothetical protein
MRVFFLKWFTILGFIFILFSVIFGLAENAPAYRALIWPVVWITSLTYVFWPLLRKKGD